MKPTPKYLFILLLLFTAVCHAQIAVKYSPTTNALSDPATALKLPSGYTFTALSGSTVDFTAIGPPTGTLQSAGVRNRVGNGAGLIDQANAAATQTASTFTNIRIIDRWRINLATSEASSVVQQVSDAPTGFTTSLKFTVGTSAAPAAGDSNVIFTAVEGSDIYDFAYGTSSAAQQTLSFWVKSNVTGTRSVALQNSANNRSYLGSYTVNSAAAWEKKTITFTGDLTGTWLSSTNTVGLYLYWDLGSGSTFEGTTATWTGSNLKRVSSDVKTTGTTSATFQLTGIQLEPGPTATTFEMRPFDAVFQSVQRYYAKSFALGTKPANAVAVNTGGQSTIAGKAGATAQFGFVAYPVRMVAAAGTLTLYNPVSANSQVYDVTAAADCASTSTLNSTDRGFAFTTTGNASTAVGNHLQVHWTADAGSPW